MKGSLRNPGSHMQVYMEQIHDLLADKESVRLKVKQGLGGSHVPGLTEIRIVGMEQAWTYLKRGQQNRMMAATAMNSCSSRSHCLMCLRVQGRSKLSGRLTQTRVIGVCAGNAWAELPPAVCALHKTLEVDVEGIAFYDLPSIIYFLTFAISNSAVIPPGAW